MIVPQRTCIGCRQVRAKKALIRIVRSPGGRIITVDPCGKGKGRGTYVCPNVNCINMAMQPERLNKAFRLIPNSAECIGLGTIGKLRQNLFSIIDTRYSMLDKNVEPSDSSKSSESAWTTSTG